MKNKEGSSKNTKKNSTKKETINKEKKVTKVSNEKKNEVKKVSDKVVSEKKKRQEKEVENTSIEVVLEDREDIKVEVKDEVGPKKKGDLFLVLGLVIVLVLGFFVMRDENAGPTYTLPLTLSGEAGLKQLSYAEYQEKIDRDEEFVVILERATCSHCVTYLPIAEQFASDNGLPMYYVDTDTFSDVDWVNFEKSNSYLRKAKGNWGTPTTVVLAGSEAVDYIEGTTNAEELLELYRKYFDMGE